MKLITLLDLNLLRYNAIIYDQVKFSAGLFELEIVCHLTRNYGIITKEKLVEANLSLNYFEREVVEIWGEGINKLGIVLKGEK